ncbi:hypothetical protein E2C01_009581 [Portunus trituberculatus]|uniref:Uncharacterized protein n=1 Tax=Portunus trituberculatus TaxID=210409 RepID=A0A5B7D6D8_PORTR|nr:hypothetical protein [Portunus trituberculatus]
MAVASLTPAQSDYISAKEIQNPSKIRKNTQSRTEKCEGNRVVAVMVPQAPPPPPGGLMRIISQAFVEGKNVTSHDVN